ncbi:Uncharacterised protein r2_g2749 [Pycnogonum litorale]
MIAEIISKKSEDELFSSASVKLQALSIEDLLDLFSCLKISCQSKLPATVWMKFYEKLADQYFSDYWSGKLNIEPQILSLISMEFVRKILNEGCLQNSELLLPEISEEEKTVVVYIGGYCIRKVVNQLYKKHQYSRIYCLKSMLVNSEVCSEAKHYKMINSLNRGGLSVPSSHACQYFLEIEHKFRTNVGINYEGFIDKYSQNLLTLFKDATKICDIDENIKIELNLSLIKIYFKTRNFAHIKNLQKKCSNKTKSKGIRKSLKKSECSYQQSKSSVVKTA